MEDLSVITGYSQENVPRGQNGLGLPAAFADHPIADSQVGIQLLPWSQEQDFCQQFWALYLCYGFPVSKGSCLPGLVDLHSLECIQIMTMEWSVQSVRP